MITPVNPLGKVGPGEKLKSIPRAAYNAIIDTVNKSANGVFSGGDGRVRVPGLNPVIVLVLNDSGDDVPANGILKIHSSSAPISAIDSEEEYKARILIKGVAPGSNAEDPIVITLEPIADGAIGRAVISGVVPVLVEMDESTDTRCAPVSGETGYLLSSTEGPIPIIHLCSSAGDQHWAYVSLNPVRPVRCYISGHDAAPSGTSEGGNIGSDVLQITVNPAHGLLFYQPTPGVKQYLMDIAEASETVTGVVNITSQSFSGLKMFTDDLGVDESIIFPSTGGSYTSGTRSRIIAGVSSSLAYLDYAASISGWSTIAELKAGLPPSGSVFDASSLRLTSSNSGGFGVFVGEPGTSLPSPVRTTSYMELWANHDGVTGSQFSVYCRAEDSGGGTADSRIEITGPGGSGSAYLTVENNAGATGLAKLVLSGLGGTLTLASDGSGFPSADGGPGASSWMGF